VEALAREGGTAAELAASRKKAKYTDLANRQLLCSVAAETQGPLKETACDLHVVCDIDKHMASLPGDERETSFLYQRLSIVVQRFNSVLLHCTIFFG